MDEPGRAVTAAPPRGALAMIASVFGAFAAGPALGVALASATAPGSELAQLTSPLAFVATFAGGLLLWFGAGAVAVVGGALVRMLRGRWRRDPAAAGAETEVPPGYGVFVPLGLALGLAAGVVAGALAPPGGFWIACAAHVAVAGAYGAALRALARRGYLPFPEPS